MLLHCISLTEEHVGEAYSTIRKELTAFDASLGSKEEIVVLTKSDLVTDEELQAKIKELEALNVSPTVVSAETGDRLPEFATLLSQHLQAKK